jgi:hypothetical protein
VQEKPNEDSIMGATFTNHLPAGRRMGAGTLLLMLSSLALGAWTPKFHEAQTRAALRLIPHRMAAYLKGNLPSLVQGARGQYLDPIPTVEEVEAQFHRIVSLSEEQTRPEILAGELGVLAHQVQLLCDPSATQGSTPLRDTFQTYGEEKLGHLVLVREAPWAHLGPLDPRPALLRMVKTKYERYQTLATCFDDVKGQRVGPWDDLSIPYAQLQLSFSSGVNATAALWTQLWRAVGDQWDPQD